jgi:hypothetical protein
VTAGQPCSIGQGNPATNSSSRSAIPIPRSGAAQSTGWTRHRRLQVGDEVVLDELVAGQVPLHEGLVLALADDALDEFGAEPVGLTLPGLGVGIEQGDQPPDGTVGAPVDQVHGVDAVPEQKLAETDGLLGVGAGAVELGDDDGPRHADRRALLPELHRRGVDAVHRRDDEEGRVGRAQAGPQLPDEVRRAGGVEQRDAVAGVLHGGDAEGDRSLLADLHGLGVQGGRAVLDAAGPVERAGGDEQCFGKRGLARAGVADECDVPYLGCRPRVRGRSGVLGHGGLLSLGCGLSHTLPGRPPGIKASRGTVPPRPSPNSTPDVLGGSEGSERVT